MLQPTPPLTALSPRPEHPHPAASPRLPPPHPAEGTVATATMTAWAMGHGPARSQCSWGPCDPPILQVKRPAPRELVTRPRPLRQEEVRSRIGI